MTTPIAASDTKSLSTGRYIKLDKRGQPLSNQSLSYDSQSWACVIDTQTHLTWEVKSRQGTLNKNTHTYSWYNSDIQVNGGFRGYENNGHCAASPCNTEAFTHKLTEKKYCGSTHWRVPTREELRSLVDYSLPFPGPVINIEYFPNTLPQFYWSAISDASNRESAWGIGFTFGYDYSYFKSNAAALRLVHD